MASSSSSATSSVSSFPSSSSTPSFLAGLAPPSLRHEPGGVESEQVLRSLYPDASLFGGNGQQHTTASGFHADAPVYRSVHMEMSSSLSPPAPFELQADSHSGGFAKPTYMNFGGETGSNPSPSSLKFVPQQQLSFSKNTMELPPPQDGINLKPEPLSRAQSKQPQQQQAKPQQQYHTQPQIQQQQSSSEPPNCPTWLEPQSHFYCTCAHPSSLYETVQSALQSLHESGSCAGAYVSSGGGGLICTLDCEPIPARFKIACTANTTAGATTPFIVRIYTADAASHKYCVEFQRRQGDVVHFFRLYQTARARIQSAHPLQSEPHSAHAGALGPDAAADSSKPLRVKQLAIRSWSAPTLPAGPSFCKEHICSTIRSLLAMTASPCIDIKLQGVLALAELSCSPSFASAVSSGSSDDFSLHEVLVSEGCCATFLSCLPDSHVDLHRASLTALANLCETQTDLCRQLVADDRHLSALMKLAHSDTYQVVRQCARIWSSCASSMGHQLLDRLPSVHRPAFCDVVKQLLQHRCKEVKEHAQRLSAMIADKAIEAVK